jgi:hypothetical protein
MKRGARRQDRSDGARADTAIPGAARRRPLKAKGGIGMRLKFSISAFSGSGRKEVEPVRIFIGQLARPRSEN